jgi:hypothetical protein
MNIFTVIQTMLAPAVMISCCGLLLLSLTPKLSRVLDRIRLLNQEMIGIAKSTGLGDPEHHRIESIQEQINMLVYRAQLLKTSSGLTLLGILFFVVTSVFVGMTFVITVRVGFVTLVSFLVGMICVVIGVGFAYWETHISHFTIKNEIKTSADIVAMLLKRNNGG